MTRTEITLSDRAARRLDGAYVRLHPFAGEGARIVYKYVLERGPGRHSAILGSTSRAATAELSRIIAAARA
jgi:hypothetical protein